MKKLFRLALVALAVAGLSFNVHAEDEDNVSLYIYNTSLDTPIEFGKIPWDAMVYDYTGGGTNVCPCMSTNKYYYVGKKAHSIAVGKEIDIVGRNGASADDAYTTIVGAQSSSSGYGNVLVGHMTSVTGNCATVVGRCASANSYYGAVAVGLWSKANKGYSPIAIGNGAVAEGDDNKTYSPLAIGLQARAEGHGSVAIGLKASALASGSIQIGSGINDTPRTAKIGNAYFVNVADVANQMKPSLDNVSDVAGMKAWLTQFCTKLTVPYEMDDVPVADPEYDSEYRTLLTADLVAALAKLQQFDEVQTLAVAEPMAIKSEASPTWHDVVQYVVMAILAIVAIFRRKKTEPEDDDVPPADEFETKKRRK